MGKDLILYVRNNASRIADAVGCVVAPYESSIWLVIDHVHMSHVAGLLITACHKGLHARRTGLRHRAPEAGVYRQTLDGARAAGTLVAWQAGDVYVVGGRGMPIG